MPTPTNRSKRPCRRYQIRSLLSFDEKSFINSTGLAVLMDLLLPLRDQGKQITLVHPKAHFRRVFEITGMAGDFEVAAQAA